MSEKLNQNKILNIYTDIDTVLDTRAGLLEILDKDLLERLLLNGKYDSRIIDQFDYIPKNVFNYYYKNRDKQILLNSTPTKILDTIQETYINSRMVSKTLEIDNPILYVNVYPYKLNEDEKETMGAAIAATMIEVDNIVIVDKNPTEMSPDWLRNNIKTMFLYNGMELLEYYINKQLLRVGELANINLIVPSTFDRDPNLKDTDYDRLLKDIGKTINSLIDLTYSDVSYFNLIH